MAGVSILLGGIGFRVVEQVAPIWSVTGDAVGDKELRSTRCKEVRLRFAMPTTQADLVRALAWPGVTLSCILLLRGDLSYLVDEIARLLGRAKSIKAKAFGIALDLAIEIGQKTVSPQSLSWDSAARQIEFSDLAAEYRDLRLEKYEERVAARRRIGDKLGVLVIDLGLDRNKLSVGHEGERVALATVSLIKPLKGDVTRLLSAASTQSVPGHTKLFKFTGYRIVLALTVQILDASASQLKKIESALSAVEENAGAEGDPALQALIDRTKSVVFQAKLEKNS